LTLQLEPPSTRGLSDVPTVVDTAALLAQRTEDLQAVRAANAVALQHLSDAAAAAQRKRQEKSDELRSRRSSQRSEAAAARSKLAEQRSAAVASMRSKALEAR